MELPVLGYVRPLGPALCRAHGESGEGPESGGGGQQGFPPDGNRGQFLLSDGERQGVRERVLKGRHVSLMVEMACGGAGDRLHRAHHCPSPLSPVLVEAGPEEGLLQI